jgi:MFS family permease
MQISGINLVTYYAATIFENSIGLSPFMSRLLSALNGTEYWIASWIAVFTIEKFGRRPLMLFGAAGMSISMAILAGATSHIGSASLGILAVRPNPILSINSTNTTRPSCSSSSTPSSPSAGLA